MCRKNSKLYFAGKITKIGAEIVEKLILLTAEGVEHLDKIGEENWNSKSGRKVRFIPKY